MTMKRLMMLIAICLLGLEAQQVFAQTDPLEPGRQAFREGRYEDAAEIFGQVARENPQLAEAHFLLSRVYFETPLYDEGRARRTLERALEIEPENVEYLVARLEQYRVKSWGLLGDRLREARRLETARKILKVDPSNAHAHEELGRVYIRDFWRYRNAIMLPSVSYGYAGSGRESDAPNYEDPGEASFDDYLDGSVASDLNNYPVINPNEVFLGDQFDIKTLRAQGVDVLDLSRRAERAYQRAIAHLEKALEVDPRRRSVYDEMMQIYVLKGEYEDAMNTLDLMYRFYPEDSDLWRYLGVANYRMGNMDAANRSFETAFGFMDGDERRAYEDLGLFLTRDEKKLEAADSVAYRARYWASQDPRFLTSYNERRLEHYFRLTYADLLYSSTGLDLRGWETERGQILIRYGPPISDIVLHPQEDGIFSARQAVVGAMVNSVTSAADDSTSGAPMTIDGTQSFGNVYSTARQAFEEMNAYNIWEYGDFRFVFEDPFRNGEYRMYSPSAEDMATRVNSFENDYIRITKEIIRETPQRYEYEAPGRQIELPFLVSSFKGDGQQTEMFVNYGIPLESTYDPSAEMIEVNASAGTFLINDQREVLVERTRNIYGLPTNQVMSFAEQYLWVDTQQMRVPSGTHELSVEFETASGQTVAVQRREITVPEYDQPGVILSDIMLAYSVEHAESGRPGGAAEIVRRDWSILPAPWSVYSAEWPIYLYFEIYGLALSAQGNTDYDVEITLEPKNTDRGVRRLVRGIFGRDREGVSVSYNGSGSQTEEYLYQILDASDQETGLYTLTLVVRDNATGKESERVQDLFLED